MPQLTFEFNGKAAVVTGASRGLGAEIALALAGAGARVLAVARDQEALVELAAQQQGIEPWPMDVLDPAFPKELASRDVDVLINNVGMNRPMPIHAVPVEVLDDMLNLNVRSVYLASQAAVQAMLRQGRGGAIINITSQMGHVGSPQRTVYCMTKHALEGLTKAMAVELAPHGIRVNAVAPTFIETPMTRPMLADPAFRQFVDSMIPLGRLGSAADVAAATLFLASPLAGMVTGTSLLVDGGWTAQ